MLYKVKKIAQATKQYNLAQYFDNKTSYYIIYELKNFKNSDFLTECHYSKDNIILANRSIIFFNEIDIVSLIFYIKDFAEKFFYQRFGIIVNFIPNLFS